MGTALAPDSSTIKTWSFVILVIGFFLTVATAWNTISSRVESSSVKIEKLEGRAAGIDTKLDVIIDKISDLKADLNNKENRKDK